MIRKLTHVRNDAFVTVMVGSAWNHRFSRSKHVKLLSGIGALESGMWNLQSVFPRIRGSDWSEDMFDLNAVQQSLREFGLDGWLFYDFRGSNILARRVLELDPKGLAAAGFSTLCRPRASRKSWCIASRRPRSTICPAKS